MDAHDWDERYAATELLWSEGPNRFVEEVAAGLPAGRALDVACGEGRNAIWLAQRGWRATGVDFSPKAIEKARRLSERAGVEVEWRCTDVLTLDVAGAAYDLVLVAYLHLPPQSMSIALSVSRKALAPGGTLFLVGHARSNLTRGVGGPRDPAVLYEPDDVVGWLGDLGVVRAEHVTRSVETEDGTRDAIDTLVLARAKEQ